MGNTTWTYTYDTYGNMRTASDGTTTHTYTYPDAYDETSWQDLLTSYDGNTISYDAIGNPTTWYDGSTFTWVNGRRLASATNTAENLTASYTYDSDGLRLTKTINGVEHKYLWQGSKLVSEYYDGKELEFFYDESGNPYAFSYKASSSATPVTYYYLTNLQGDITGILDASGTSVAAYTYNAWGKLLSSSGDMASINPLRYRGYYYDDELEMYYLKSRYYDPEICRFISADGYVSIGQDPIGNNLLAYCENNPVNRTDPNGMFWEEIGDFFKRVGTAIADFAKATFGAEATVVHESKQEIELSPSIANLFITVKTGTKESKTVSSTGNSSKPVSAYAQGRSDNPLLSSSGLKINIASFTLNACLGLDNIGICGSIRKGDTTRTFGLKADLSQLKIGVEGATTIKWDESTNVTSYTNVSVTGWGLLVAYLFITTGQWYPSPQTA